MLFPLFFLHSFSHTKHFPIYFHFLRIEHTQSVKPAVQHSDWSWEMGTVWLGMVNNISPQHLTITTFILCCCLLENVNRKSKKFYTSFPEWNCVHGTLFFAVSVALVYIILSLSLNSAQFYVVPLKADHRFIRGDSTRLWLTSGSSECLGRRRQLN